MMLDYCNKMGITQKFMDLLLASSQDIDGASSSHPLNPGMEEDIVMHRNRDLTDDSDVASGIDGLNWQVQRPPIFWNSNMHWISPSDEHSHNDYLKALSAAGFDEVLEAIGEHFELDGLACYHVTFIGVSYCERGYSHYDVRQTGKRAWNVIFPLLLASDMQVPELDLQQGSDEDNDYGVTSVDNGPIGRLKYQYNVATMMGDSGKRKRDRLFSVR